MTSEYGGAGGTMLSGESGCHWSENYCSVTLFTIWTGMESNPGLRGESPATNRASHGTALDMSPSALPSTDIPSVTTVSFEQTKWLQIREEMEY